MPHTVKQLIIVCTKSSLSQHPETPTLPQMKQKQNPSNGQAKNYIVIGCRDQNLSLKNPRIQQLSVPESRYNLIQVHLEPGSERPEFVPFDKLLTNSKSDAKIHQ